MENNIEEKADKYFQEQYPNGRMVGSSAQVFSDALNDIKFGYQTCTEDVVKVIEAMKYHRDGTEWNPGWNDALDEFLKELKK